MDSRKRKPLSDITDHFYDLIPTSDLRDRIAASTGIFKSIFNPNSTSTNRKFAPVSSDRSNTSIGSSSVGAAFSSKTVRFEHPSHSVSPATSPGDFTNGISSRTPVEKRKATSVPFSSSASLKMKDAQNKICNLSPSDSGMGIQKASYNRKHNIEKSMKDSESDASYASIMKRMDRGKTVQNIEKSRKERESDVSICHTSMKRMDKGKAIVMPYSSSPIRKLKGTQNNVCHSSTFVERSFLKGMRDIDVSSGSVEKVKETNKDMLASCSHSSGKMEKGKANLNSSDRALGKKSEIGKDTVDADAKKGILKRTRSSTLQIKEIGEDYLNFSSTLVGGAKDRGKSANTFNSLPDKAKGKGKMFLEPSNMIGSSDAGAVKSQPSRDASETSKNAVEVSSCPPMTRTRTALNDLDDAWDVKYSFLGTDPQANGRKKRGWRNEETIELPEEFIREKKAYYDDIDSFELPVEEVSADELD